MKVLLLTHIYPPAIDGGSQVIYKFGKYLKSQGHQIKVITSNCHSTDDFTHRHTVISKKDTDIFRLPAITFLHRPLKFIYKFLFLNHKSYFLSLICVCSKGPIFSPFAFIGALISVLKFHPDLIVAGPLPTTIVLYARFLKKISGAKLLINASFHSTDKDFHQHILIKSLQSTNFLWTLTNFETDYFHKNFHIPYSKMINVGNGIDQKLLTNTPRQLPGCNLLFIGSFASHKGIGTLIKAFQKLPSNYHLTIAGKPTLHPIDFPQNITVIKNFKSSHLSKLLDNNDILISPSTQESFGLVLLEAMARGIPVVATNIPASTEIVTKSGAGLLFKQDNSFDLSKKIKKLTTNQKLYKKCSQSGLLYAQSHTWDKIGEALCQKIYS
ncbi:glycosyltransferase family 4 protein [Candidatus Shapirobacteria bacterium]|nr:glycosyltransferase family 4 protein [Candidatus Shapirobacteria bacterium]